MIRKWKYKGMYKTIEDLTAALNDLDKKGIKPEHIKISSSSFGDYVYYYGEVDIMNL